MPGCAVSGFGSRPPHKHGPVYMRAPINSSSNSAAVPTAARRVFTSPISAANSSGGLAARLWESPATLGMRCGSSRRPEEGSGE